ncbi:MAG: phosphodiester glycosidase family protein [Butyricicoccaceae bacterium]
MNRPGEDALGLEYAGKLALCKKPENVYVGTCEGLGDYGSYVSEIADRYSATLGINASGFADYEGNGTGGLPYGFSKSEGTELQGAVGNGWKIIGYGESNHLQVGEFSDTSGLRDAVEFHPALIINGQNLVAGTGPNDRQPRAAIGQAKGRHGAHARHRRPSVPLVRRFDRALRRDHGRVRAYQASMLDGGSSSVMVYRGREITSPTTLAE